MCIEKPVKQVINRNLDTKELENDGLNCDSKQLLGFLEKRKSIRNYKAAGLSEEKKYLSKVASLVPKGGHTESLRNTEVIIIENEELINEITALEFRHNCMYCSCKKVSGKG